MPVGGSTSATALNKAAGARSRLALVIAGVVMAVVVLAFAGLVGHVAMPALAGLLILIGYQTIKPRELWSVWKTGVIQKTVLATSFALTMLIPLQYAVLAGVALSMVLHVVQPVQPGHHQAPAARPGLAPDRDRPAGRAPGRRGTDSAAPRSGQSPACQPGTDPARSITRRARLTAWSPRR